jgi:ABC-2 type transport system ATP-binding protein
MSRTVIEFNHVSKKFTFNPGRNMTLKDWIVYRRKYDNATTINVLDDVSFVVEEGESLGIIGRNGSGKSTILKILSKIYYPTTGNVRIDGKVSSLIELGAGFHPEMSGRENIRINASINGLSPKEINERMDEIIEFSELGDFIDKPIKVYSSGMYMRLAFSVAINIRADILLIDEILAVGDIAFQKKCFDKLQELKKTGITIVLISHSTQQIIDNCNRAIWIDDHKIVSEGEPTCVCNAYIERYG